MTATAKARQDHDLLVAVAQLEDLLDALHLVAAGLSCGEVSNRDAADLADDITDRAEVVVWRLKARGQGGRRD